MVFEYPKSRHAEDEAYLFSVALEGRMRTSGKLHGGRFQLNLRRFFLRAAQEWRRLPQEKVAYSPQQAEGGCCCVLHCRSFTEN